MLKNPYAAQQACFSIQIKGATGDSVNGLRLQINNGKVLAFHRTIHTRQFIIGTKGKVWMADENRHEIPMTAMNNPSILSHGDNELKLSGAFPEDHSIQFKLVFSFMGVPEKLLR